MNMDSYEGYQVIRYISEDQWKENCYLLINQEAQMAVIIDPGYQATQAIHDIQEIKCDLRHVLLTHGHFDHIAGVADVEEYFSLPCLLHPNEKVLFLHAPMYSLAFGKMSIKRPRKFQLMTPEIEQELLSMGIYCLLVPGHTNGSVAFFYQDVAFTGDLLIKGYVGRTDLPEGNADVIESSIEAFLLEAVRRNVKYLYPGHGEKWSLEDAVSWWDDKKNHKMQLMHFLS